MRHYIRFKISYFFCTLNIILAYAEEYAHNAIYHMNNSRIYLDLYCSLPNCQ